MAKPRGRPSAEKRAGRRWRRVRVLRALIAICGRLERLQGSGEARQACREVAAKLGALLAAERAGRVGPGR